MDSDGALLGGAGWCRAALCWTGQDGKGLGGVLRVVRDGVEQGGKGSAC